MDQSPSISEFLTKEPADGWEVDFRDIAADGLFPLSRESDLPTRLWVVTRAGGIGGLVGCRALGFRSRLTT